MPNHKLYIFDIDGTILTTDYQVLPSTRKVMALLREKGKQIILASARSPKAIDPIVKELDLERFYVSLNGAFVVQKDHVLYEKSMPGQALQRVIDLAQQAGLSVNVYSTWDWFIEKEDKWSSHEGKMVGYYAQVRDLQTVEQAHKILLLGDQDRIITTQKLLCEQVPEVSATLSIPNYLEVVDATVNKGNALDTVSTLLDIDSKDIVAFGDGENDRAMLEKAGFSVAMGNAHPSLKKIADFVTSSNNQDGVLEAVMRIIHGEGAGL